MQFMSFFKIHSNEGVELYCYPDKNVVIYQCPVCHFRNDPSAFMTECCYCKASNGNGFEVDFEKQKLKTAFDMLSELQHSVGYTKADPPHHINLIALLGSFGEAGEVLEVWLNQFTEENILNSPFLKMIKDAVTVSKTIDHLKKLIRDHADKNEHRVEKGQTLYELVSKPFDSEEFDMEISDQLYYLNALANIRGKTLEDYAMISFKKVKSKLRQNIEHGVTNLEMPKQ